MLCWIPCIAEPRDAYLCRSRPRASGSRCRARANTRNMSSTSSGTSSSSTRTPSGPSSPRSMRRRASERTTPRALPGRSSRIGRSRSTRWRARSSASTPTFGGLAVEGCRFVVCPLLRGGRRPNRCLLLRGWHDGGRHQRCPECARAFCDRRRDHPRHWNELGSLRSTTGRIRRDGGQPYLRRGTTPRRRRRLSSESTAVLRSGAKSGRAAGWLSQSARRPGAMSTPRIAPARRSCRVTGRIRPERCQPRRP
jgi:hypothetical protein